MRKWSTSGRVKIERAKEHIRRLDAEILAFRDMHPYQIFRHLDAHLDPREGLCYCVRVVHDIDPHWGAIAADAIHNLNVALDHLWQRALYGTRGVRHDHFPAFPNPEKAKVRFRGKENGSCKRAVDLLWSIYAFEIGNPFWRIREFDDADKHDTMVLAACQIQGFHVDLAGTPMPLNLARESWRILKDGAPLYTVEPRTEDGGRILCYPFPQVRIVINDQFMPWNDFVRAADQMNVSTDLAFAVTFGESEVLEREPVVPTLSHMAASVDGLSKVFLAAGLID